LNRGRGAASFASESMAEQLRAPKTRKTKSRLAISGQTVPDLHILAISIIV